jgi:uncharacterized protein (DUF486 family)
MVTCSRIEWDGFDRRRIYAHLTVHYHAPYHITILAGATCTYLIQHPANSIGHVRANC